MANMPSLEEIERFLLDIFAEHGTRPGSSINRHAITSKMVGCSLQAEDINRGIQSMEQKKWVAWRQNGLFLELTELGFSQV